MQMSKPLQPLPPQAGLTLVETMVSTVLLSLMLGISLEGYAIATIWRQRTQVAQEALAIVRDDVEQVRQLAQDLGVASTGVCATPPLSNPYTHAFIEHIRIQDINNQSAVQSRPAQLGQDASVSVSAITTDEASQRMVQTSSFPILASVQPSITLSRTLSAPLTSALPAPTDVVTVQYTVRQAQRPEPLTTFQFKVMPNAALVCP